MSDRTPLDSAAEGRIEKLLIGAIDPHVHSGPSIAARGIDHVELVRDASAAGFAAVVTKDHDYAGVATAKLVTDHFPELSTKIYSSIVLNNVVGGMNPYAVEHTAAMGGKVVWMPTLAAQNHMTWQQTARFAHPASTSKMRPERPVLVLTANGAVRDDVREILDIVAAHDLALASGHLHVSETWLVFEEAKKRGVKRLVFTHPEEFTGASLADVEGIAAIGAFIEHSLAMFVEGSKFQTKQEEDLRAQITAGGLDQTILCSDLGQTGTISPLEGFRQGIRLCIKLGYDDAQIRKMVSLNAARALDIPLPADPTGH